MSETKNKPPLPSEPYWRPPIHDTHSIASHHYSVRGYAVVGKVYEATEKENGWFYTTSVGLSKHTGYKPTEAEAKAEIEKFIEENYIIKAFPDKITEEVLIQELLKIDKETEHDLEVKHMRADEALCQALEYLGYKKAVEVFNSLDKWYK